MKNPQPLFDPTTHYRIEVQGQVDVNWLQNFEGPAEIHADASGQVEDTTVLNVRADQSGIVGLLRTLHGLGVTIRKLQITTREETGG